MKKMAFYPGFPLLITALCLFIGLLFKTDHHFFKRNGCFCLHNIFSSLPNDPTRGVVFPEEKDALDKILSQQFLYLGRGNQSYVFASEDNQWVIKFYSFPSHLRTFSFFRHPISYQFGKRTKLKENNLKKLASTFQSYKLAFDELKEESGLVFVHLNKTDFLKKQLTLIDRLKMPYEVDLDELHFIVQRKADPFFERLKDLIEKKGEGKAAIKNLLDLIVRDCQKGIVNNDAVLAKNYGWLDDKPIYIDVGRFERSCRIKTYYKQEVLKVTQGLKEWLEISYPELALYYKEQVDKL